MGFQNQSFKDPQVIEAAPITHSPAAVDDIVAAQTNTNVEDAFFVADIGEVVRQLDLFHDLLPRIEPFYAVKCNPDHHVISTLAKLGVSFDCASKAELKIVLDMGVSPDRIIYAHPCKPTSHLSYAAQNNVRMMTFDNVDELEKISRVFPNARAVMRILADDSKSMCKLSLKFGAPLSSTASLFEAAKYYGVNVVGVSFHVGSGCLDENAYLDAVSRARSVFDQAKAYGFKLNLLDVGGGFPGANDTSGITFEKVARVLNKAIDTYFPAKSRVRIIAEPGRFFVASAFNLVVNVIARRVINSDTSRPTFMYYVNDGIYGSFNCIMFDHQVVHPEVVTRNGRIVDKARPDASSQTQTLNNRGYECSIWGPTCDSIDCIVPKVIMPELSVGDWILFRNMGAYTLCAASQFNGFRKSSVFYANSDKRIRI